MLSKRDFELDPNIVFLNHGSFGACASAMIEEQVRWIKLLERQPVLFHRNLPEYMRAARTTLAEYLGAEAKDLVAVLNATHAANAVVRALVDNMDPGSEILTTNQEYGACDRTLEFYANRRGVGVVRVDIPLPAPSQSEIINIVQSGYSEKTRVLFISHVTSPTAIVMPVQELCTWAKEQNITSVVDGAHSPGMFDVQIPLLQASVYFANCHKWMCTPKGSAFMWVTPELQKNITPFLVSWGHTVGFLSDSEFINEHEYFGTRDPSAFLCLPFAVNWMNQNNWPIVQENARSLVRYALQGLTSISGVQAICENAEQDVLMLGAVLLPTTLKADNLKVWLYEQHIEIVVQEWQNKNLLRVSAHAHTTHNDIVYLIEKLKHYLIGAK